MTQEGRVKILGRALYNARKLAGITQENAANHIGIKRTTLSAIEQGTTSIRSDDLAELAVLYGVDAQEIMENHEVASLDLVWIGLTQAQKSVVRRLINRETSDTLASGLQMFGMDDERIEEVAATLLQMLVAQEEENDD